MLVTLVLTFGLVAALVVVMVQVVCFALALYELMTSPDARLLRLDAGTLATASANVVGETALLLGLLATVPLGWLRSGRRSAGSGTRAPVVLVPGRPFNRASFWIMRRRLRRDGWSDVTVAERRRGMDLVAEARALRDVVATASETHGGAPVLLVAHGTGGLVARACLRYHDGLRAVAKLLTLATPHQGSKLCMIGNGRLARDLRPDSPFLQELGADDPVPTHVDCTAIYSSFDLYVLPSRLAYYPNAGNIEVEGVGHFGMLSSSRVYELVRENLEYVRADLGRVDGSSTQPAA